MNLFSTKINNSRFVFVFVCFWSKKKKNEIKSNGQKKCVDMNMDTTRFCENENLIINQMRTFHVSRCLLLRKKLFIHFTNVNVARMDFVCF